MIKKSFILLLGAIIVLSLISCNKKIETPPADKGVAQTITGESTTENKNTEVKTELKKMTYDLTEEPPTIDPQLNSKSQGSTIIANLFEGLTRSDKDYNILPGIAETWDLADDKVTYTFHLRDSAWSDGVSVTAHDFVFAWQRAIRPETGAKYASQMYYIKNGKEIYEGQMDISELGVKEIDARTLEVTLNAPISYALELFSDSVFMPVREDILKKDPNGWSTTPENCISNGPFKLTEHKLNDKMVLVPNDYYWGVERVHLDELKFTFISDTTTALSAFEAGEIDGFNGVPTQEIPRLKVESDEFYVLPGFSVYHNPFNVNKAPMDDVKVREALVKAIDRQSIIDTLLKGTALPATGFVPYGIILNDEDFREAGSDYGILPTAQIELAKSLLKEAGYPDGAGWPENVEYVTKSSGINQKVAEVLQEMWKQNLNIDIDIVIVEGKVESERRRSGQHSLSRSGWGGDYYNPMTFLDIFTSFSGNNSTSFDNLEFDKLIKLAKSETDLAKSLELMHQAEDIAMGEYIVNPVYYPTKNVMMKKHIINWGVPPIGPVMFDEVDIRK